MTTCARCAQPAAGQSKYCATHRAEARAAFRQMVAEKATEREERQRRFLELIDGAYAAYVAAYEARAAQPAPLVDLVRRTGDGTVVAEYRNVRASFASGDLWLPDVKPNTVEGKALQERGWRKDYRKGMRLYFPIANDWEEKDAGLRAMSQFLRDNGITAFGSTRGD